MIFQRYRWKSSNFYRIGTFEIPGEVFILFKREPLLMFSFYSQKSKNETVLSSIVQAPELSFRKHTVPLLSHSHLYVSSPGKHSPCPQSTPVHDSAKKFVFLLMAICILHFCISYPAATSKLVLFNASFFQGGKRNLNPGPGKFSSTFFLAWLPNV